MIPIPHTYYEWVQALDMLESRADDAEVINAMKQGSLSWQSGVAERFSAKLTNVINSRLNAASDRFQRSISNARGSEAGIIQALLALRKELAFLSQAIDLPVIPQKDRPQYCQLVRSQADSIQSSLEKSAKADRTGKMSKIINDHKVNLF